MGKADTPIGEFYYSNDDGLIFKCGRSQVCRSLNDWVVATKKEDIFWNHTRFQDLEEALKNCLFREK